MGPSTTMYFARAIRRCESTRWLESCPGCIMISAMRTLRQKIGQVFLVGCQGEALTREERLIFEQCSFGGFILFGHNCCEPRQILSLCRSLWQCASEEPPF